MLSFTKKGIYCEQAAVYLDPWFPVERALISHGHSDHARYGMKHYLTQNDNVSVIKHRLGSDISVQGLAYGEPIHINGVTFSFHPAGHLWGSSQIRVAYKGEVWVFSGDYKLSQDPTCTNFEPVNCHTFITESTFGLPVFNFPNADVVFTDINNWWLKNQAVNRCSVILAYALGKAQRITAGIDASQGKVFLHGAVYNMNQILIRSGMAIPDYPLLTQDINKNELKQALIIAPPSAENSPWLKRLQPLSMAVASGWMHLRGMRRRRAADRGFVLSDHADWNALNQAVALTGAEKIFVTHGYTETFAQWLRHKGLDAQAVKTDFAGDHPEIQTPE